MGAAGNPSPDLVPQVVLKTKRQMRKRARPDASGENFRMAVRWICGALDLRCPNVWIYIYIYIYTHNYIYIYGIYPLIIKQSYWKLPCLVGKASTNGPCSIAMLDYQRVFTNIHCENDPNAGNGADGMGPNMAISTSWPTRRLDLLSDVLANDVLWKWGLAGKPLWFGTCLVGGLEHFLFSTIYGIILPID